MTHASRTGPSAPPARAVHAARPGEGGFVLTFVIFALAALSVGATAAFLVVQAEARMATGSVEGSKALQLADAGLIRYAAQARGPAPDSAVYELAGGTVVVRARRVLETTAPDRQTYLLSARARVVDARMPGLPAERTVHRFATLNPWPVKAVGAVTFFGNSLDLRNSTVEGHDAAMIGCGPPGGGDRAGIAMPENSTLQVKNVVLDGSPPLNNELTRARMYDSLGIDWSRMLEPDYLYDHDIGPADPWPSLVAGQYPMVRFDGDLHARAAHSGSGLLVVTGEIRFSGDFSWDGVILAGDMRMTGSGGDQVNGAIIAGLDVVLDPYDEPHPNAIRKIRFQYDSCEVQAATQQLARLIPLDNTWWEAQH